MALKILMAGFIFCAILLCGRGFAQPFSANYSPARNYRPTAEAMKTISGAFNEEIKNNLTENKKVREMINESISELSKYIAALDSFGLIMDSDSTTHYLKKIVAIKGKRMLFSNSFCFTGLSIFVFCLNNAVL
jgi:hypothetical protein